MAEIRMGDKIAKTGEPLRYLSRKDKGGYHEAGFRKGSASSKKGRGITNIVGKLSRSELKNFDIS